jgi:multidrug transporter EmrE-like cation transporter
MKNWIVPLSLLILFELIADVFVKEYSIKNTWLLWGLALLSYVVANAFWLHAIKNGSGLGRGTVIFAISAAVIGVALGVFWYDEPLSKPQIFGAILGIVSLVFIFWE